MSVQFEQKPAFKRAYKKLHTNQSDAVHAAIRTIVANPREGQEKRVIWQAFLFTSLIV
ncbi:MAG: hypothetical protein FD135_1224 [Comamonadaceae bacterium]|nr:MAG: hypothetical protein FD135_1224 [Comamonadaceae bacterium]